MNVKNTFLKLTSWTVPHGQESMILKYLPKGTKQDRFGNFYYQVGKSRTIFTSHLDTVCSSTKTRVNHVIRGNMIHTDGKTTLGADDKAGVTVMLYMIEKRVPGLYYFFVGEEVGCVGSSKAAKDTNRFNKQKWDRMVSFDRRDTCSVITYQSGQRCCSETFATELAKQLSKNGLNLRPDNTGVYTDSAKFMPIIPECTNISVGYYSEHSSSERQNIDYLSQLCENVCLVDWENLPTQRDPGKVEYRNYGYSEYGFGPYGWGPFDDYEEEYINHRNSRSNNTNNRTRFDDYNTNKSRIKSLKDKEFWREDIEPLTENDFLTDDFNEGNKFLDDFLNPISLNNKTEYFDTIKDKYLDDLLSDEEIDIIVDNILDLNDHRDVKFLEELNKIKKEKKYLH